MVDIGQALHYSGSSSTVDNNAVFSRVAALQAESNVYFMAQLGLTITFNTAMVATAKYVHQDSTHTLSP
jgi:hypothetical protein